MGLDADAVEKNVTGLDADELEILDIVARRGDVLEPRDIRFSAYVFEPEKEGRVGIVCVTKDDSSVQGVILNVHLAGSGDANEVRAVEVEKGGVVPAKPVELY